MQFEWFVVRYIRYIRYEYIRGTLMRYILVRLVQSMQKVCSRCAVWYGRLFNRVFTFFIITLNYRTVRLFSFGFIFVIVAVEKEKFVILSVCEQRERW